MVVKILKAGNGDSVIISWSDGSQRNLLVDGGHNFNTYQQNLYPSLLGILNSCQQLDLMVVTHLDQDHIKGILYLLRGIQSPMNQLNRLPIKEIWFNSKSISKESTHRENLDISTGDMLELEALLHKQSSSLWNKHLQAGDIINFCGACITILSPDSNSLGKYVDKYQSLDIAGTSSDYNNTLDVLIERERRLTEKNEDLDVKLENAVSIAFLIEHDGKSILLLGDAIPEVIDSSIGNLVRKKGVERLKVDAVKLSHHGSRRSLSNYFLKIVDTSTYIISTNGKKSNLPNKAIFAKILAHSSRDISRKINFYFNYGEVITNLNFSSTEYTLFNFNCFGPNYINGYSLEL